MGGPWVARSQASAVRVLGRAARKAFPLWVRDLVPLQGRDYHKWMDKSDVLRNEKCTEHDLLVLWLHNTVP